MLWLPLAAVPFLVGVAFGAVRSVPRPAWLLLIAILTCVEIAVVGKPSDNWESKHIAALWLLGALLPWGAVALFVALSPLSRNRILAAAGVPLLYFLTLTIGLLVGDSLGLIPQ